MWSIPVFPLIKWALILYGVYYVGFCLRVWAKNRKKANNFVHRFKNNESYLHCCVYKVLFVYPGFFPKTKEVFVCEGDVISPQEVERDKRISRKIHEKEKERALQQKEKTGGIRLTGGGVVVFPDVPSWEPKNR